MSLARSTLVLFLATLGACGARTTLLPGSRSDGAAGTGQSAGQGGARPGGAGQPSAGDAGAPGCTVSVLQRVPDDHATNVPLGASVHVVVGCLESGGVLPAQLSLTLGTGGTLVFGYSSVQGAELDFTAVGTTLSLGAIYTVQVLANGRLLASFQFAAVEGSWQSLERVTTLQGAQQDFAASVNSPGTGVVAYSEQDATTNSTTISARFFDLVNGLTAPSEVAVPAHAADVHSLRIGLNALQGAALTWVEYRAGQYSMLAALHDASSWAATQQISPPTSFALESLGLAVSGNSQRALLWKSNPSGVGGNELLLVSDLNQLGAAPFTVASGVGSAGADLAFDTNGLFVVWDRPSLNARYRHSDGSTWDPPSALGSAPDGGARVAAGWGGNALVVYPVSSGSNQTLSAQYYTPSSGWGEAQSLDTHGGQGTTGVSDAHVALDAAGNGLAIWTTTNTEQELRSQRYRVESGWAPTHDMLDVGATSELALALDSAGNGFAIGVTPSGEVRAARFRAGSTWQPSVLLATLPMTTYAAQPKILFDIHGRGAVIWRSDLDLMIRRFSE